MSTNHLRRGPERFVEGLQHLLEFAAADAVEPGEAAALTFEDEVVVVQSLAVNEYVGLGLGGDSLQPLALRCAPCA